MKIQNQIASSKISSRDVQQPVAVSEAEAKNRDSFVPQSKRSITLGDVLSPPDGVLIRDLLGMQQKSVRCLNGGDNTVYFVDNEWIVRFPKFESAKRANCREHTLLLQLKNQIQSTMIPNYEFWDEALGAGGYRAIQGRTLSRAFMQRCSTSERKKLAQDIARALVELHKFPAEQISVTLARAEDKEALRLNHFDQIFACEKPFTIEENAMIAEACAIVQEILTGGTYAPVLLHGDLHCDNIIVHEKGRSLAGLIDFSDAVLGPAVFDFIGLYRASPALAEDVQHHYAIAMGMNEQELRRDCRAVAVVIYARDVLMQRHESGIQAIRRLNRSGYVMRSLFESGWTGPMAT